MLTESFVSSCWALAVGAFVIALLLWLFNQNYAKDYLTHWNRSWISVSLFHLGTICLTFGVIQSQPLTYASVFLLSAIPSALQASWILSGSYELARQRPLRQARLRLFFLSSVALSVGVAALVLTNIQAPVRQQMFRLGVRGLLIGLCSLTAAVVVWHWRGRRGGAAFMLLGATTIIYGYGELHLGVAWLFPSFIHVNQLAVGFVDLLLQGMLSLGMVIALLEDEREAAVLASSQIEHLAYHDPLTGLPNRALFFDRLMVALANADRYQHRAAVLFLDLDRFKEINDSLGHSTGDALLRAVARRVRDTVRSVDTLSRFGGDEFTLLVSKIDQPDDAYKIASKILEMFREPFIVAGRELSVTTSVGVSVHPEDGMDAESLVKNSDAAMYRAKQRGRDNYQMYTPALNDKALERLELENRLRRALDNEELELFYQPIVHAATRTLSGAEALLRWRHPELGLIGPGEFINAAEVSGLIVPIGDWVLRKAARQAKVWSLREGRPLSVSVNLSARQFQQHNLVERVRYALVEADLDASQLELEITESSAMENAENSVRVMDELKGLGVRLALDDFGTGYSSLNYLRRFPLDTVKLDKAFVHEISGPGDGAIAKAVIAMSHGLGLRVTAEGVETEMQMDFLVRQECDLIQGFLCGEPVPAGVFDQFFARTAGKFEPSNVSLEGIPSTPRISIS